MTTDTAACTVGFVANVCVEKLYERWNENVLVFEGVVNPFGFDEVL